jgi:hypothetical protein
LLLATQVAWSTQYETFGKVISNVLAKVPTLHLVIHDSTGATVVVQWRDGKIEVLDNPLGVFANDPLLQDNIKVDVSSKHPSPRHVVCRSCRVCIFLASNRSSTSSYMTHGPRCA